MARILIVDDALFMRNLLKGFLQKNSHEVVGEAENGILAIEFYQKLRPDIVMMDITMPEIDGIEATSRLKEIDPDARIIICSAVGQQSMVRKAIFAGAKDFIVKPFDDRQVLQAIEQVLKSRS